MALHYLGHRGRQATPYDRLARVRLAEAHHLVAVADAVCGAAAHAAPGRARRLAPAAFGAGSRPSGVHLGCRAAGCWALLRAHGRLFE
jgi:hypothetical protein